MEELLCGFPYPVGVDPDPDPAPEKSNSDPVRYNKKSLFSFDIKVNIFDILIHFFKVNFVRTY